MNYEPLPCSLKHRHVLVVEDEIFLAIHLAEILTEAELHVIGPAATLGEGLRHAETIPLHAALLDINLGDEQSFPIAYRLEERRIPFCFVTGYADYILPPPLARSTIVGKPYRPSKLLGILAQLLEADAACA
jgi:DNA-binding response OmpR family regulator